MSARKTHPAKASVADFLKAIPDPRMRDDCRAISRIMQAATGARPRMWGSNLVGFGIHRHVESNGRVAEWMLIAFSPRRTRITLYIMDGLHLHGALLAELGPHGVGKACLHVKRLSEIRLPVLTKIIHASVHNRKRTSVKPAARAKAKKAKPKAKAKAP
ncbi:MAG: hypothetical protein WA190_12095 [Usitatibacter sp.]